MRLIKRLINSSKILIPFAFLACSSSREFQELSSPEKKQLEFLIGRWELITSQDKASIMEIDTAGRVLMTAYYGKYFQEQCADAGFVLEVADEEIKAPNMGFLFSCRSGTKKLIVEKKSDSAIRLSFRMSEGSANFEPMILTLEAKKSIIQPTRSTSSEVNPCNLSTAGQNALKIISKDKNKGRFGFGYQLAKWGMCPKEIAAIFPDIRTNPDSDEILNLTLNELQLEFVFFEGILFKIHLIDSTVGSEDDHKKNIVALESKFGPLKPFRTEKLDEFTLFLGRERRVTGELKHKRATDGYTQISATECQGDICLLSAYTDRRIIYANTKLSEHVAKLEKSKQKKKADAELADQKSKF